MATLLLPLPQTAARTRMMTVTAAVRFPPFLLLVCDVNEKAG